MVSPSSPVLSPRSYSHSSQAYSWEEIWEAGHYYQRISEMLEQAQNHAILVGWQIDSRLPFHHPIRETLKEKILRLCQSKPDFQFYLLMWDYASLYVFEREFGQGRIWEDIHPRVHFIFDNRHPFGGSHHEKICIIDGKVAFCGGIDLCGDRWDSPLHLYSDPRRSLTWQTETHGPYHDLAVQVTGPICAELQAHVGARWRAISSVPFPEPESYAPQDNDEHRVYFSRTLASIDAGSGPPLVREIEFLFRDLILGARNRIILEGQYYWSREINDLLIAKIHQMAHKTKAKDFEIILILADLKRAPSLTRVMAPFEMSLLDQLQCAARASGVRLITGAPYAFPSQGEGPSKPVYIHSKLIIIDDRYLCIGSANFASRALRIDTEICLTFEAQTQREHAHIQRVAQDVLKHWNLAPDKTPHPTHLRLVPFHRPDLFNSRPKPWYHRLVDPVIPWPYRFKRRTRELLNRKSTLLTIAGIALWGIGVGLAMLLSGVAFEPAFWPIFYVVLLTSSWILPVPVFPLAALASIQIGWEDAARIVVVSIWVSSLYGYMAARMFPTLIERHYARISPSWLPERMGHRNFKTLISILSDPRVALRSKIAYQGLYYVPLPWFALGTWVVLPAALYLFCRAVGHIAGRA